MTRSRLPGRPFLHDQRLKGDIQRAGFEQAFGGIGQDLRGRVVDIGFDHGDAGGFGGAGGFAEDDAQHVGLLREIVIARAVSGAHDLDAREARRKIAPA